MFRSVAQMHKNYACSNQLNCMKSMQNATLKSRYPQTILICNTVVFYVSPCVGGMHGDAKDTLMKPTKWQDSSAANFFNGRGHNSFHVMYLLPCTTTSPYRRIVADQSQKKCGFFLHSTSRKTSTKLEAH